MTMVSVINYVFLFTTFASSAVALQNDDRSVGAKSRKPPFSPSKVSTKVPSNIPSTLYPSLSPSSTLPSRKPRSRSPSKNRMTTVAPTKISSKIPSNTPSTVNPSTQEPYFTQSPSQLPFKIPTKVPSRKPTSRKPSSKPEIIAFTPTVYLTIAPSVTNSNSPITGTPLISEPSRFPSRSTSKRPTKILTIRPTSGPRSKVTCSPTTKSTSGYRYWMLDDFYSSRSCDYTCGSLSTRVNVACSTDSGSYSW